MHETLTMPPHPSSVRRGRDAIARWLSRSEHAYPVDATLLLTGELVTYALMRARREVALSLTEQHGSLHVEIRCDPPLRGPALVVTDGAMRRRERGLPAARSIATAWGTHEVVDRSGTPSAVAWFELAPLADAAAARPRR